MNLTIKIVIGVVGYCMWAIFAYYDPALRPDFLKFNIAMVMGTIGLALRDMQASGNKEKGFASPALLLLLSGLVVFALSGCSSLQNAGNAEYSVKPFTNSAGTLVCCEVSVKNGKEIALLEAHVSKQGDNYTVDLKEQGVLAFEGQGIAAGALKTTIDAAVRAAVSSTLGPLLPALGAAVAK